MELSFTGEVIEWRGPAPFYFVAIPESFGAEIKLYANQLSYGWGVIPVIGKLQGREFNTSLIPRGGVYLLPLKNAVRLPAGLSAGDLAEIELNI